MKVLFVCNQNKYRSKTAEEVFKNNFETKSAGLFGGELLDEKLLSWADVVCVMEEFQRAEIGKRFPSLYLKKKIISLDVPDVYSFGELELISLLRGKISNII
ncbi:MAG: phosphotyrosine protein phosphatase [Candidatus Woesearchaeota archaeon]